MELGAPRVHLRTTSSTSDAARVLAQAGAPHGTLVTAARQTAGRGRQGRTWSAPEGRSLLMSLVLRDPPPLLPLVAAVAFARTCGTAARIKWPNDILIEDRKVAGILAEGRPQEGWAVLGVGVNVAVRERDLPDELRATAASLGREPRDVEPFLAQALAALRDTLGLSAGRLLDEYRARDALRGRTVRWNAGEGVAAGIDGEGRLVVELAGGGRTALDAGEVHLGSAVLKPPA